MKINVLRKLGGKSGTTAAVHSYRQTCVCLSLNEKQTVTVCQSHRWDLEHRWAAPRPNLQSYQHHVLFLPLFLSTIHPHHNVYSPFIYSLPFLCHFPFMCVCVCPLMLAEFECERDCIVNMCSSWFLHDCRMHWWIFFFFFLAKNAIKYHFWFWLIEKIDQIVEQKALL